VSTGLYESNTYTIVEFDRTDPASPWQLVGSAPFSGRWRDLEEVLTPKGDAVIFASNRPMPGSSTPMDGHYNGKAWPPGRRAFMDRSTLRIWVATSTFSPAIARDGTLYFMHPTRANGKFHIFMSLPIMMW
jgi:hypothetical protein